MAPTPSSQPDIDGLKAKIASMENDHAAALVAEAKKAKSFKAQNDLLRIDLEKERSKIEKLTAQVDNLGGDRVKVLETENGGLNAQVQLAEADKVALECKLTTIETENGSLLARVQTLETEISEANQLIRALESQVKMDDKIMHTAKNHGEVMSEHTTSTNTRVA